MQWTVVMPLNDLRRAKSRLIDATATAQDHQALVLAMRTDALAACAGAANVARIVVVTDGAAPADDVVVHLVPDPPEGGLNAAIRAGEAFGASWPEDGIAVVVSDLPCLTGAALEQVLDAASAHPRALVTDRQGTGTTMLTARPGNALAPQFGTDSARRHAESGAVAVCAQAQARTDVDTAADLEMARSVGAGRATAAFLRSLSRA